MLSGRSDHTFGRLFQRQQQRPGPDAFDPEYVGLTYHQLRLSAAPGEHIALGDSFALGLGMIFVLGTMILP